MSMSVWTEATKLSAIQEQARNVASNLLLEEYYAFYLEGKVPISVKLQFLKDLQSVSSDILGEDATAANMLMGGSTADPFDLTLSTIIETNEGLVCEIFNPCLEKKKVLAFIKLLAVMRTILYQQNMENKQLFDLALTFIKKQYFLYKTVYLNLFSNPECSSVDQLSLRYMLNLSKMDLFEYSNWINQSVSRLGCLIRITLDNGFPINIYSADWGTSGTFSPPCSVDTKGMQRTLIVALGKEVDSSVGGFSRHIKNDAVLEYSFKSEDQAISTTFKEIGRIVADFLTP